MAADVTVYQTRDEHQVSYNFCDARWLQALRAIFGDAHSLSDHLKRNRCAPFGPALRRTFLNLYNVATMKGTLNAAGTLALADCALLHITLYGNP